MATCFDHSAPHLVHSFGRTSFALSTRILFCPFTPLEPYAVQIPLGPQASTTHCTLLPPLDYWGRYWSSLRGGVSPQVYQSQTLQSCYATVPTTSANCSSQQHGLSTPSANLACFSIQLHLRGVSKYLNPIIMVALHTAMHSLFMPTQHSLVVLSATCYMCTY